MGDHTETIQIDFDPSVISYGELLDVFWTEHRPTSPPHSRQYMSAILYHSEAQRVAAEASRDRISSALGNVYTRIAPFERFYLAEEYHQKYYAKHGLG